MVAVRNRISQTRTGIYLEHSTNNSQFVSNQISKVGTGFKVEWRYDGVGSNRNRFSSNRSPRPQTPASSSTPGRT